MAIVTEKVLLELSHKISREWKDVARHLELTEGDIEHIATDYEHNIKEKVFKMLLFWKQRNGQRATYRIISEALVRAGRRDLADNLKGQKGKVKVKFLLLCFLPVPVGYMFFLFVSHSNNALKEKSITSSNQLTTSLKENTLQWFEFIDNNFLTIGGVMVKPNQMVHVILMKNVNGVVLNCFNPHNREEKYWQFVEKRVDRDVPIVMSRRAIFYDDTLHVLFAAGNKVFIVHLYLENNKYTKVDSVSVRIMDVVDPGTWITTIFGHQPTADPCDEFLLTVSSSTKLFVFKALGTVQQIIETKDARLPGSHLSKVAFCENNFAIVNNSSQDIALISVKGQVKQFTPLRPPVSGYVPLDIICTGVRWLVLYVKSDNHSTWLVATYKTKHNEDFKINDEGIFGPNFHKPVSITHSQKNGYVTFANDTVQHFRFGTWKTDLTRNDEPK